MPKVKSVKSYYWAAPAYWRRISCIARNLALLPILPLISFVFRSALYENFANHLDVKNTHHQRRSAKVLVRRVGFYVCGILNRPLRAAAFYFCSNVLAFGTKIMGSGSREVEDLCRVCAKDKSNIQLFSESGMKHKLINKIKKYLSIVVS